MLSVLLHDASSAFCVIVVLLLLLVYLYRTLVLTFTYWQRRGVACVASPASLTMLLRFCGMLLSGRTDLDAMHVLYELMADRPFGGIYMVTKPVLVLKDPYLIRRVFTKDFQHFVDFGFSSNPDSDPIAKALIYTAGREWKTVKPKLATMFSPSKVREMAVPAVVRSCDDVLIVLGGVDHDSRPVEVVDLCRRFTMDCFAVPYLGLDDVNIVLDEHSEFVEMSRVCLRTHFIRHIFFGALYPEVHRLLRMRVTTKPVREFFQLLVNRLVVSRRERCQLERDDFLQTLLNMKDEYDRVARGEGQENTQYTPVIDNFFMVSQVFIFFVAGFETTAKTLSFCLYELALHMDIQQKVRAEAQTVLGEHKGSIITEEMLQNLKYTWQVLSETMRKYPVFSAAFRRCTQDYKIPDTDVIIEKGTLVLIPRCAIHWDSKHYPDPERFDPERFNEENEQKRNPGTFLPFGAGPRVCSGAYLASVEMKTLLAKVLLKYEITLNKKTNCPLKYDPTEFILTPKGGVFLNLRKLSS